MRTLSLVLVLLGGLSFSFSASAIDTVNCDNCSSGNLNELGVYGAAELYRPWAILYPTISYQQIWVTNNSGNKALVTIKVATDTVCFFWCVDVPRPFHTEIGMYWHVGGAGSNTMEMHNEILKAQADMIDAAMANVDGPGDNGNEITPGEAADIAPFDGVLNPWLILGVGLSYPGVTEIGWGVWLWESNITNSSTPTAIVTIEECKWSTSC